MLNLRRHQVSQLIIWPGYIGRQGNNMTYPDSVKRVRPPKTTMPKTLAALPSSQYATLFEFVSGKLVFLAVALAAPGDPDRVAISCASLPRGVLVEPVVAVVVVVVVWAA
jgi:hypothetical protein